jgi:hypothetical protein
VFGVIPPDSPLWAPVLGLFAFTGIPMAGAPMHRVRVAVVLTPLANLGYPSERVLVT